MISKEVSRRIVVLRPLLIFLILTTHIHGALYRPDLQGLSWSWGTFLYALLTGVIALCALPLLSIVSGYLAGSITWARAYPVLLWEKFRTLILPMLFWNLLMALWIYEQNYAGREIRSDLMLYPFDAEHWFYALTSFFRIPANSPLYFLRELFLCFMLFPLFQWLARYRWAAVAFIAFVAFCYLSEIHFGFFIRFDVYGFFMLGILLARCQWLARLEAFMAPWVGWFLGFFALCCIALALYAFAESAPHFLLYMKTLTLFGPLALWLIGRYLQDGWPGRFLTWLSPVSFSVFLGHVVIITLLFELWRYVTGGAPHGSHYILFWGLCVVLSFALMAALRLFWHRCKGVFQVSRIGALFVLFGVFFAAMAVYGTWLNYTPVPYWDMWNGYLLAVFRMDAGEGWMAFWELHNEHRLVLAKALFWIDVHVFNASLVFLFALNILFALANFLVFAWVARELVADARQRHVLLGLVAVLCFSWLQQDNFTWAFQSQFFCAYLLPLLAFVLLARSCDQGSNVYFCLATLLGVLSSVTMANGLLALPLLALFALLLRLGWLRVVVLAGLAVAVWVIYFQDFAYPPGHVSLTSALRERPLDLLGYLLAYLGGPWFFLADGLPLGVPMAAGAFLIVCSAWFAWLALRESSSPLQLALLVFLLFVGGTALGTASGRLEHGPMQALTSRYLTPQLLAWCALLVLAVGRYGQTLFARKWVLLFALLPLLLMKGQWEVRKPLPQTFERMVSALALQVGADDEAYLSSIYFYRPVLLNVAAEARRRGISAFAHPSIQEADKWLGRARINVPAATCQGQIEQIVALPGGWRRVEGWLLEEAGRVPKQVLLLDEQGRVVGYALAGKQRRDLRKAYGREAREAGFVGYLKADGSPVMMVGRQPGCFVRLIQ